MTHGDQLVNYRIAQDTADQTGLEENANTFRGGRRARSRDQQVGEEHGGWRLRQIRKKEPQFEKI